MCASASLPRYTIGSVCGPCFSYTLTSRRIRGTPAHAWMPGRSEAPNNWKIIMDNDEQSKPNNGQFWRCAKGGLTCTLIGVQIIAPIGREFSESFHECKNIQVDLLCREQQDLERSNNNTMRLFATGTFATTSASANASTSPSFIGFPSSYI